MLCYKHRERISNRSLTSDLTIEKLAKADNTEADKPKQVATPKALSNVGNAAHADAPSALYGNLRFVVNGKANRVFSSPANFRNAPEIRKSCGCVVRETLLLTPARSAARRRTRQAQDLSRPARQRLGKFQVSREFWSGRSDI